MFVFIGLTAQAQANPALPLAQPLDGVAAVNLTNARLLPGQQASED